MKPSDMRAARRLRHALPDEPPLDADPKIAEIQARLRLKTKDLKAGRIRGRANKGPTEKR